MSASPHPAVIRSVLLLVLMWGCIGVGFTGRAPAATGLQATVAARRVPPAPRVVVPVVAQLPGGGTSVYPGRFLVAYYGLPGTPALGALGDGSPDQVWPHLEREARGFARPGVRVQPVFEVIATVASRGPGPRGDYTSDVPRAEIQRYIDAAHRLGALVVLDVQPGRSSFTTVARRWTWAMRDPWVGLALDPEWRMGPGQLPGHVIGSVDGREIDQVARWLDWFTVRNRLPQKVFLVHQFIPRMIRDRSAIHDYAHLALVQQADGFGAAGDKLASYHSVAYPARFVEGFKLFYHWDVHRMRPSQVLVIRPRVQFVSFQ